MVEFGWVVLFFNIFIVGCCFFGFGDGVDWSLWFSFLFLLRCSFIVLCCRLVLVFVWVKVMCWLWLIFLVSKCLIWWFLLLILLVVRGRLSGCFWVVFLIIMRWFILLLGISFILIVCGWCLCCCVMMWVDMIFCLCFVWLRFLRFFICLV